jgi:Flp pilus assembly protein TadG
MTRALLQKLWFDEGGASIIEMAFVAPILAGLVIGMSDLARAYSTTLLLEQAAQRTVEEVENQRSVASSYNTAVTTEAGNAMSDAGFTTGNTITPDSWLECSSNGTSWTRQSDFNGSCPNANDMTARYVSVRIQRKFTPFFPSRAWPGADANGDLTIAGYSEVRIQ